MITETLCSLVATLGFAIIFNIQGRNLIFTTIGGGIAWFIYSLGLKLGFSDVASLFASSVCFSIYSEVLARKLKTPVTTLVVCALLPLVPGAGMYYTMYSAVSGDVSKALELGLNTLASAGTLALGVMFVSTITRQYYLAKTKRLLKKDRLNNKK